MKVIKGWNSFNEGITNQVVIDELKQEIADAKKSGDTEREKTLKNKLFSLTDGSGEVTKK